MPTFSPNNLSPFSPPSSPSIGFAPAPRTLRSDLQGLKSHTATKQPPLTPRTPIAEAPTRPSVSEPPANLPSAESADPAWEPIPTLDSPFLTTMSEVRRPAPAIQSQTSSSTALPHAEKPTPSTIPTPPISATSRPSAHYTNWKSVAVILILVALIAGLSTGGYYFFKAKKIKDSLVDPTMPSGQTTPTEPEAILPFSNQKLFSLANPNYLPLDVETITPAEITNLLTQTAAAVQNMNAPKPVEFILTDNRNAPIAFSRFALLTQTGLSADLLDHLEESFSFFFFSDPEIGGVRVGLSIELKNREALIASLRLAEPTLTQNLRPLFLTNQPQSQPDATFRDGTYQGIPVRFLNMSDNFSIDYTITSSALIIGTSKNTLRAIIDQEDQKIQAPLVPTSLSPSPTSATPS